MSLNKYEYAVKTLGYDHDRAYKYATGKTTAYAKAQKRNKSMAKKRKSGKKRKVTAYGRGTKVVLVARLYSGKKKSRRRY